MESQRGWALRAEQASRIWVRCGGALVQSPLKRKAEHDRFPLDAAAYAGSLLALNGITGEHGLDGCAEIVTRDRPVVAGAAVIEVSMVGQAAISIKEIEFRSAGGAIGFCDLLGLVVTEWKGQAQTYGHFL